MAPYSFARKSQPDKKKSKKISKKGAPSSLKIPYPLPTQPQKTTGWMKNARNPNKSSIGDD